MSVLWEVVPSSGGSFVALIIYGRLYVEIDGLHLL